MPFLPLAGCSLIGLDTVVFRDLCYGEPPWLVDFEQMSKEGYVFALQDHLLGELVDQLERGSVSEEQIRVAVCRASRFLSPVLPLLPGKRDLAGLTHCMDPDEQANFDEGGVLAWLSNAWELLRSAKGLADLHAGREYVYSGDTYLVRVQAGAAALALESEREGWKRHIKDYDLVPDDRMKAHRDELLQGMRSSVDTNPALRPPLSTRLDLAIVAMLEKMLSRNRSRSQYNPDAPKKRNDGIDYNMAYLAMIPAFVVSSDKRFVGPMQALPSFQSGWFMTPEELVEKWKTGRLPRLEWPGT